MKKLLLGLTLVGMASVTSKALPFTWIDLDSPGIVLLPGATYNNSFNVAAGDGDGSPDVAGFTVGVDTIISGTVGFNFVQIGGGGAPLSASYTIDSDTNPGPGFQIFSVLLIGGPVTVIGDLQADGILNYTIKNTSTVAFRFDSGRMNAFGNNVPDGGSTVMLLGSTLMGMAALARRKK